MKKIFITSFLVCFIVSLFGQTIHEEYWDGVLYLKVKKHVENSKNKDEFSEPQLFRDYIEKWTNDFDLYEFQCPFRTMKSDVQSIYRIQFSDYSKVDQFEKELFQIDFVEWAEKSPILRTFTTPDDPIIHKQYYLERIKAFEAWGLTTGDRAVKVAIVDDAFRISHPDLAANVWVNTEEIPDNGIDDDDNGFIDDVNGWNAADNNNNPNPPVDPPIIWGEMAFTHGTHCAGIAAGVTDNQIGIASVSHNVSLVPIKATKNSSFIPLAIGSPAEGVDYAIKVGADIVSMSFGGEQASGFNTLETLINAGHEEGIIFVAAAGNNGDGSGGLGGTANAINYPAGFENVLAIGATDSLDKKPGFSQYGTWIDVMAPGASIYSSLAWSTEYDYQDGTSMACPLVAGTLALMKSYEPHASKEQLISCLKMGCDNIDDQNSEFIGQMGAGRINVYNSLLCLDNFQSIAKNEQNISFYPNPASKHLHLVFENNQNRTINIYNTLGQNVLKIETQDAKPFIEINTLFEGFYILEVVEINRKTSQKLVIKK